MQTRTKGAQLGQLTHTHAHSAHPQQHLVIHSTLPKCPCRFDPLPTLLSCPTLLSTSGTNNQDQVVEFGMAT